jgi:hypothetical protein
MACVGVDGFFTLQSFPSQAPSPVLDCRGLILASGGLLGWWRRRFFIYCWQRGTTHRCANTETSIRPKGDDFLWQGC